MLLGCLISVSLLVLAEIRLRSAGVIPSVHDSLELWSVQRTRASSLGDRALIIVGASRALLGIDHEMLRQKTGLEPVQLSIDGSGFLPVLEDLAIDPRVTGTVLVSATVDKITPVYRKDRAHEWVAAYNGNYRGLFSPTLEARIRAFLSEHIALYASPIPLHLLPPLLFQGYRLEVNHITYRDRRVDTDYTLVKMPEYYLKRVARHHGKLKAIHEFGNLQDYGTYLGNEVGKLQPENQADFLKGAGGVALLADTIHKRGGKVVLLRMPTGKLVWEIDRRRYPRERFWNRLSDIPNITTIHFQDYAGLQFMELPDGSHIDMRDKARFTGNLADILTDQGVFGHPETP